MYPLDVSIIAKLAQVTTYRLQAQLSLPGKRTIVLKETNVVGADPVMLPDMRPAALQPNHFGQYDSLFVGHPGASSLASSSSAADALSAAASSLNRCARRQK